MLTLSALELTKEIRQNKDEIIALEGTLQNARPAPVLYTDQAHELSQRINSLANIMPGKGRKSLAYMPADVKDEARDIADWILSRPGFKLEAKKYIETAEGFSRHYSKHEDQIKEAGDKAYGDLRDRVAQEVLGHAGIIQRDIEKIARRNEVNILSENESLEHRDLEPEKFSDSEIAVRGEQHPSGGASGGAVGNGDGGSCGGGNGSTGGSARDSAGDSAGGGGEGSSFTGAGANISDTDKVLESLYKRTCRLLERDIYEKIGVFERTKLVYDNTQKYFEEEILCDLETLSERIADIEGKPVVDYFSKEIKEFVFNITEKLLKQNDIALLNNMSDSPDGVKKAIAEEVISHAYDLVPKDIPEVMVEKDIQRAEEAIKKIPDGNVFFIRGDLEEIEWTIKTLYRSYLMLGFEEGEATNNAIFFSEKNGFDNARKAIKQENERLKKLKELLEKKGKAMPTYISRKDWTRLRENLGYKEKELLYPWFGVVNNQAETERDKIKFEVMEEKANEFHAAILHGFNSNIDNKEILWTIKTANFALQSFNVQAEEREAIVSNWCLRSQLKIPEARIKDIIDRSELLPKENFCLGREKWGQLINNLGMEEMESPWRFKGQTNYINRVWKSIWTAIKREQARQEMEAAISRRKLDRKLARVAEEQERNNKQRR